MGNSTYKKLAVQWLNEALYFVASAVLADNFVLRNRQLLIAANRWRSSCFIEKIIIALEDQFKMNMVY